MPRPGGWTFEATAVGPKAKAWTFEAKAVGPNAKAWRLDLRGYGCRSQGQGYKIWPRGASRPRPSLEDYISEESGHGE